MTLQDDLSIIQLYLDNGLTPIPVYPQTKSPCVAWEQYQNFKPSECEIKEWLRSFWNPDTWRNNNYWKSKWIQKRRDALLREGLTADQIKVDPKLLEYDGSISVAILGGKNSGNTIIFDDDAHVLTNAEIEAYKEKTLVMETNSGNHIYLQTFSPPPGTKDGKHGEVRAEGGYAIAAPSTHVLGKKYRIISQTTKVLKFDNEEKDKAFWEWAEEKLVFKTIPKQTANPIRIVANGTGNGIFLYPWHRRFIENFYVDDHLNELCLKLFAISVAKTNADTSTAADIILQWAEKSHTQKNAPMTVDKEKIEKMINSAKSLEGTTEALTPMSKAGLKQRHPELYQQLLDSQIISEQPFVNPNNPTEEKEETPKTLEEKLNEFLETDADFKTVYEGNYKKYFGKKEKAELYLIQTLLRKGFTTEETRNILDSANVGKWTSEKMDPEAREEYQDVLVEKAQEAIQTTIPSAKKESQADRLIQLCEAEKIELFHDQHNTAFARFSMPCDIAINCDKNDVCSLYSSSTHTNFAQKEKEEEEKKEQKEEDEADKRLQTPQISQNIAIPQPQEEEPLIVKISINGCDANGKPLGASEYWENKLNSFLAKGYFIVKTWPDNVTLQKPQVTPNPQTKNVTYPLSSSHFKSWLGLLMWKKEQKTPNGEAISSALNVLRGKATLEGKGYELFNRIAPAADGFYIDMADEKWRAIKVTAKGWSIEENPPILFRRYSHQKPLVEPLTMSETEAASTALKFLQFVNLDEKDTDTQLALLITVISYFIPLIAHPAIVAHGTQGTAKSYLFKLIRRIVDPSSLELLTLTRDQKELVQSLDHNWACFFDNVSYLSGENSDALCRAVTGGGNSKRELWTNDDDVIYSFKRCIGLNGINIASQRGDLLDRSLLVGLVRITTRKTEEDLDKDFAKDSPAILGAFLTVLSKALRIYPDVHPKDYFRLADWTRYACAIAEALGKTQDAFMKAYAGKVQLQNEEAINASPLGTVLLDYCKKEITKPSNLTPTWEGTATELLNKLTAHATNLGVDTRNKEKWPSAANALSRALNRVSDALLTVGCVVTMKEGTPRKVTVNAEKVKYEPSKEEVDSWDKRFCGACQNLNSGACLFPGAKADHKAPFGCDGWQGTS